MLKKRCLILLVYILFCFFFSCQIQHDTKNYISLASKPDTAQFVINEFVNSEHVFYTKQFKYTTTKGYIRHVTRLYFGPSSDILKDFDANTTRHYIRKEDYSKFPIASFFNTSAIHIPNDKKEKAITLYKPLFDTILSHLNYDKDNYIQIVVLAFTDESTSDRNDSILQDMISNNPQFEVNSDQTYNILISYYRAKEIGSILYDLIQENKETYKNYHKVFFDILEEGRGTELPDQKRNYNIIDDKRRIAKVYWKQL